MMMLSIWPSSQLETCQDSCFWIPGAESKLLAQNHEQVHRIVISLQSIIITIHRILISLYFQERQAKQAWLVKPKGHQQPCYRQVRNAQKKENLNA